jgi:hypothetical protein
MAEQWVPMSEAAYILRSEGFEISASKLSRMARAGEIRAEQDPVDKRIRLVDLIQLRQLFSSSKRYRK